MAVSQEEIDRLMFEGGNDPDELDARMELLDRLYEQMEREEAAEG
jgi:hypothetical protein